EKARAEERLAKKRLITVELFPRGGDVPESPGETIGRIVQLINRVRITRRSIGNIYEFGVFANWMARFLDKLVGVDTPEEKKLKEPEQATVLSAAVDALKAYFDEDRPGDPDPKQAAADCVVPCKTVTRIDEIRNSGLLDEYRIAIETFYRLVESK